MARGGGHKNWGAGRYGGVRGGEPDRILGLTQRIDIKHVFMLVAGLPKLIVLPRLVLAKVPLRINTDGEYYPRVFCFAETH
jgi:hypothetical protein